MWSVSIKWSHEQIEKKINYWFSVENTEQLKQPHFSPRNFLPSVLRLLFHKLQLFVFNMATIYFPHLLTLSSFWLSFFLNYDFPLSSHLISSNFKDWQCRCTHITAALKKIPIFSSTKFFHNSSQRTKWWFKKKWTIMSKNQTV